MAQPEILAWHYHAFLMIVVLNVGNDRVCVILFLLDVSFSELSGVNRVIVPFLACGDLSAYDSDMTYPLEVGLSVLSKFLHGYCDILAVLNLLVSLSELVTLSCLGLFVMCLSSTDFFVLLLVRRLNCETNT